MSAQFDEAQFKQRTREMVAFFKEKGVDVPLTLGYEGAARFLMGAKSWNNLASDLKKGLVSPNIALSGDTVFAGTAGVNDHKEPLLKYVAYVDGGEEIADMVVFASFYSSDGQVRAEFPVTNAFRVMRDESLLSLAAAKWTDPKFMEPMAVFRRGDTPKVREVLEYVESRPGIELFGGVDRRDAVRYIRAFRPHLLAKALLLERFETLPKADKAGYGVRKANVPHLGEWAAKSNGERLYPDTGDSDYFATQEDAWLAIAEDLLELQGEFQVRELFDVLQGSGSFES